MSSIARSKQASLLHMLEVLPGDTHTGPDVLETALCHSHTAKNILQSSHGPEWCAGSTAST